MKQGFVRVTLFVGLLLAVAAGGQSTARAAPVVGPTFVVNSAADVAAGGELTNGTCQTAPNNDVCTLRAAIMKANHWPGGDVTIFLPTLPAGGVYLLTIAPAGLDDETTGDLNLTAAMTIVGGGAASTIIDGSGMAVRDRVLSVGAAASVSLSGVTIQGGSDDAIVGGILNGGTLVLDNALVTGNTGAVGGIDNTGVLTVTNSMVMGNTTAIGVAGISNEGRLTILTSTISGNSSTGPAAAGGVWNNKGTLKVANSTFSGNSGSVGGGLFNDGGLAAFANSTIAGNTAGQRGGGVSNEGGATLSLFNVTLAFNAAETGGSGGGIYNGVTSTVKFQNTILSNNQIGTGGVVPSDCSGAIVSQGYNDISSTSGCVVSGTATGNLPPQSAQLQPLQNYGGTTQTLNPFPTSPVIDAGNPAGCTDDLGGTLTTDQRGWARPHGPRCDMGAVEYSPPGPFLPLIQS
jgi:hypothetical protein